MDFLIVLGWLLLLLGIGLTGYFAHRFLFKTTQGRKLIARLAGFSVTEETVQFQPAIVIEPEKTAEQQLEELDTGHTLKFIGEGEKTAQTVFCFTEMTQNQQTKKWKPKGRDPLMAAVLKNGDWVFKIPSRENGDYMWMRGKVIDHQSWKDFFMGTDANPGPATRHRKKLPCSFRINLPELEETDWTVIDIGAFDTTIKSGKTRELYPNDRIYFVTSKEDGADRFLIYLDARPDEASGRPQMLLCEPFEPAVDITTIL